MAFRAAVEAFRTWDSRYGNKRSGEWECDYEDWPALWSAVKEFVEAHPAASWDGRDIEDLIYAVARDNEFEHLADVIAADPEALLLLAERSLAQPEPDARWQFAARLGTWVVRRGPAEALLLRLVDDPDEYVRRRALLSLGKMRSLHAEALAVRAWDTGEEYQRIAALWVLKDIASDKLATYVARAHEDGREHVVWNAEQVLLPAEEPGPD